METHLPLQREKEVAKLMGLRLSADEARWVDAWNDFVVSLRRSGVDKLPGFPVWVDAFVEPGMEQVDAPDAGMEGELPLQERRVLRGPRGRARSLAGAMELPARLPAVASEVRVAGPGCADALRHRHALPPSGIRAKRATYLPALVAITQTSILGDPGRRRRISPREAARLQGLPEWFDFSGQPQAATYKQLGNGVNVGAAYHVLREHILANQAAVAKRAPELAKAVLGSPVSPDALVERHFDTDRPVIRAHPCCRSDCGTGAGCLVSVCGRALGQHRGRSAPRRPQED